MTKTKISSHLSTNTDRHICRFLLSPFVHIGWDRYRKHHNLSFSEPSKQISNRIYYLKQIKRKDLIEFASLVKQYGIELNTASPSTNFTDNISVSTSVDSYSDSDSNFDSEHSFQLPTPPRPIKPTPPRPIRPTCQNMNFLNAQSGTTSSIHDIDFERPHANQFGMLWYRDDHVLIENSMHSVLTVYMPLYDSEDFKAVKLSIDPDRPNVLRHVLPKVPAFLHDNLDDMLYAENSIHRVPEVFTCTTNKYIRNAARMKRAGENQCVVEYRLPFSVTNEPFGKIDNRGSAIKKHFRMKQKQIGEKMFEYSFYIIWKVMIDDGSSTRLTPEEEEPENVAVACERMFKGMNISK